MGAKEKKGRVKNPLSFQPHPCLLPPTSPLQPNRMEQETGAPAPHAARAVANTRPSPRSSPTQHLEYVTEMVVGTQHLNDLLHAGMMPIWLKWHKATPDPELKWLLSSTEAQVTEFLARNAMSRPTTPIYQEGRSAERIQQLIQQAMAQVAAWDSAMPSSVMP